MKVIIQSENLDVNSKEEKELILRGVKLGTYNYGIYSKIIISKAENDEFISTYEDFICGMIHNYFNIPVLTKEDVYNAINICKEKEHIKLIDWINMQLETIGKKYDD